MIGGGRCRRGPSLDRRALRRGLFGRFVESEDRERIQRLEREVMRLRADVKRLQATSWQTLPAAPVAAAVPVPAPAARPTQPWPQEPAPAPTPASHPAKNAGLEARIGTRWLAVAGITLFVVAAGLFLRLAIINDWIGPAGHILSGILLGVLVWVFGIYLDLSRKLGEFSHVLAGGGVAITAFAVFASHHFASYEEALGMGLAANSILMALVVGLAVVDSALRRAEAQAIIASVLGPVIALLALELTAFSLVLSVLLGFALLAAASWRRWSAVTVLAALGPFFAIFIHTLQGVHPGVVFGAAGTLLLGFTVAGLRGRSAGEVEEQAAVVGQLVCWVATWLVGLWAFATWNLDLAWVWTAGLGVAAAALAFVPGNNRVVAWTWGGLGIAGLVGFVALLPWPEAIALGWILEMGILAGYRAVRRHLATTVTAGFVLGALSIRLLGHESVRVARESSGWALDALLMGFATLAALLVWIVDARLRGEQASLARFHLAAAVGFTLLLTAVLGSGPGVSLGWGLLAIVLVGLGFAVRHGDLRAAGLITFAATLTRIIIWDLSGVDPVWRVLAFAGVGVLLLLTSWFYVRWVRSESAA